MARTLKKKFQNFPIWPPSGHLENFRKNFFREISRNGENFRQKSFSGKISEKIFFPKFLQNGRQAAILNPVLLIFELPRCFSTKNRPVKFRAATRSRFSVIARRPPWGQTDGQTDGDQYKVPRPGGWAGYNK